MGARIGDVSYPMLKQMGFLVHRHELPATKREEADSISAGLIRSRGSHGTKNGHGFKTLGQALGFRVLMQRHDSTLARGDRQCKKN